MRFTWDRLGVFLRREWRELVTIQASDRPWEMPFGAALSTGLPMLAGAAWDRMGDATIASMAGLVFVYCRRRRCITALSRSWPADSA